MVSVLAWACLGCSCLAFCFKFLFGVSKQNEKSKMKIERKKHRALIGTWFKHVPHRFFSSEEINDFQPITNCQIQKVERPGTNDAKFI